jgi:hypothetical protein
MKIVYDFEVGEDNNKFGIFSVFDSDKHVEMYFHLQDEDEPIDLTQLANFIHSVIIDNHDGVFSVGGSPKFMWIDGAFKLNLDTCHYSCNFNPCNTPFHADLSEPYLRTQLIEALEKFHRWLET